MITDNFDCAFAPAPARSTIAADGNVRSGQRARVTILFRCQLAKRKHRHEHTVLVRRRTRSDSARSSPCCGGPKRWSSSHRPSATGRGHQQRSRANGTVAVSPHLKERLEHDTTSERVPDEAHLLRLHFCA